MWNKFKNIKIFPKGPMTHEQAMIEISNSLDAGEIDKMFVVFKHKNGVYHTMFSGEPSSEQVCFAGNALIERSLLESKNNAF